MFQANVRKSFKKLDIVKHCSLNSEKKVPCHLKQMFYTIQKVDVIILKIVMHPQNMFLVMFVQCKQISV